MLALVAERVVAVLRGDERWDLHKSNALSGSFAVQSRQQIPNIDSYRLELISADPSVGERWLGRIGVPPPRFIPTKAWTSATSVG
jgi:hypothetical protein